MAEARWLRRLGISKVALVDRGANPSADIVFYKGSDSPTPTTKGGDKLSEKEEVKKEEEQTIEERVTALEGEKTEAVTRAEKAEDQVKKLTKQLAIEKGEDVPDDPAPDPEILFKSIEDPVAKQTMIDLYKSAQVAKEEAAEIKKEHHEEVEKRLERETVAKLAPITNRLPVSAEEFAKTFRIIEKADADAAKEIERVLAAANEAVQKGLLGQLGSGAAALTSSNAEEKLDALAKERVAKSTEGLSFAKAYEEVLESDEGKALYAESLADRPGAVGKGA